MPTTIVTPDAVPLAISQLSEQQAELQQQLDALTDALADLTVTTEEQGEQLRVTARALRETAAEQSRNIAALAKTANGNSNGNGGGNGKDKGNPGGDSKVVALKDGKAPKAKAGSLGQAIEAEQAVTSKLTGGITEPPAEPEPRAKRKAHRWI